jgi:hypothetical protein
VLSKVREAISAFGGRRFLLTVGCHVGSTALLVGGYLTEGGYVTIILSTVAAFITGNTVQKVKEIGSA